MLRKQLKQLGLFKLYYLMLLSRCKLEFWFLYFSIKAGRKNFFKVHKLFSDGIIYNKRDD